MTEELADVPLSLSCAEEAYCLCCSTIDSPHFNNERYDGHHLTLLTQQTVRQAWWQMTLAYSCRSAATSVTMLPPLIMLVTCCRPGGG